LDDRTGHATVSHVIAAADAGHAVMRGEPMMPSDAAPTRVKTTSKGRW
jgi:hypothetical protein